MLIALGNSYLAIEPAVKERSLHRAMKNAFVLGCAAYATYIVPIFLMMSTWPGILVPIDILIGGLLSLITSTVVTYVSPAPEQRLTFRTEPGVSPGRALNRRRGRSGT